MAGYLTHIRIATAILKYSSSKDWLTPEYASLLLLGANAPDLGVYPGGHPILSDCAHYVRTADLVRCISSLTGSGPLEAFAIGWGTHVIADAIIHPVVNREVSKQAGIDRSTPYFDDPVAHVRVEWGYDAFTETPRRDSQSQLGRSDVLHHISDVLHQAYETTYGCLFPKVWFIESLSGLTRWGPWLLALAEVHRRTERSRLRSVIFAPLIRRGIASLLSGDRRIGAFIDPLVPGIDFTEDMEIAIRRTIETCSQHAANGFIDLRNHNLDTGEEETIDDPYPLAISTRRKIDEARW